MKQLSLFICVLIILLSTFLQIHGQGLNSSPDSVINQVKDQNSTQFAKIDSVTGDINLKLNNIQSEVGKISETVKVIDDNTNESFFTEAFKNYTFSLIYEVLGYKKNSSANLISKLVSILSLFFILLRIYFLLFTKNNRYKFKKPFNYYFISLGIILLAIPWTSNILPNKSYNESQIIRITKNAKELNDEIEKIQSANFDKLIKDLGKLQEMKIDSIKFSNVNTSIENLNPTLIEIQNQIDNTKSKLDTISNEITYFQTNTATFGRQRTQTWMITLTFLMVLTFFVLFLIDKPWKKN